MVVKSINCLISDGTTIKIDITFYQEFKKYNWCCDSKGYIVTHVKQKTLYLHHYVLNFKYDPNIDLVADHKYGNLRDYRLKKLRLVSHSINSLNQRGRHNNTGFSNIHCSYSKIHYENYYSVSYLNIDKIYAVERFYYIEGVNEEDIFLEAFNFFEDIKNTIPHYKEAFPDPREDSSSDESVEELNYEYRINPGRLHINNTSNFDNISDNGSSWRVSYYNKKGIRTSKSFPYFPKSTDTKDEALTKGLLLQKKKEKYHPKKKGKTPPPIAANNVVNNITFIKNNITFTINIFDETKRIKTSHKIKKI